MKTRDFIQNNIPKLGRHASDGKTRRCSSVIYDDGVIYSYGRHYPMLFKVDPINFPSYPAPGDPGILFLNTAGWSVSTARQISWCRQACVRQGVTVYSVKLPRRPNYPIESRHVKQLLVDEFQELARRFMALKKTAHAMENAYLSRANDILVALSALGVEIPGYDGAMSDPELRLRLVVTGVEQEKLSASIY